MGKFVPFAYYDYSPLDVVPISEANAAIDLLEEAIRAKELEEELAKLEAKNEDLLGKLNLLDARLRMVSSVSPQHSGGLPTAGLDYVQRAADMYLFERSSLARPTDNTTRNTVPIPRKFKGKGFKAPHRNKSWNGKGKGTDTYRPYRPANAEPAGTRTSCFNKNTLITLTLPH